MSATMLLILEYAAVLICACTLQLHSTRALADFVPYYARQWMVIIALTVPVSDFLRAS